MIDTLLQDLRFAWRGLRRAPGFAAIAIATLALGIGANSAIFTVINANLTEIDQPERVEALLASPSYFDVLGVRPQLGRLFGPEDNGPGITEVLVISDALWHRRFGASPDAIGRKLRIDNDWYTVVGVVPPGFRHPGRSVLTDVDVWAPANFSATPFPSPPARGAYFITGAIGRLRPGIPIADARQRLAAFGERLR